MPDVSFGGGSTNSWFDYTNQILYTNLSVPARRVAANGNGPQLITHVAASVAGYTTTVTLKLYAGGKKTGTLTRSADSTPGSTGLTALTSNLYIANGTTVSFGASDNSDGLYFNRSGSGTTQITPNGYSWGGTLGGSYRYLESPTAPRTLTATPSTTVTGQVNLSWLSPSDNGGSSVTNYNVYRVSGSTYTLLGTTTGTSYSATGLTANTSYNFAVRARNTVTDTAGTQSVDSNIVTATAPLIPPPVGAPTAPTALSATTSTTVLGAVNLSWTAPSDDGDGAGSAVLTDYDIYVNGVYFASKGGTGTTYTATGLTELSTSSFTVLAKNSAGFSSPQSTAVSGKASGVPTAPTGLTAAPDTLISEKINLSWTAPSDSGGGISGYRIYNATTDALIADQAGTGTTYSQTTGLTAGVEYSYYVRAYNAIGLAQTPDVYGAQSDVDSAVAEDVSGAPSVTASTTVAGRLIITWVANVGATSYTIRNKTTGFSIVLSSNVTTYVQDGLTAGVEYGFTKQPNSGDESEIGLGTPNANSVQPMTTSKTVTNSTNTELSVASVAITGATSTTFTYSKDVSDLSETQVASSSAVVTNKTNQDLTDSDGTVTDTISATTPQTFSYSRSGVALTETNVTGGTTLVNTTNTELSETGIAVVVPGGSTDTFTYTTTRYTGGAIEIASGGTATNLSQTDFNITQQPITAVTEYTLSYAKTTANQDASAATGTVVNATNKEVFNKTVGVDKVLSVPDYKTVKYAVVGGLHADIASTAQASTVVTVTTVANHYFRTGEIVTIQGSTNGSGVFNGQWTITGTTDTTFTFTRTTATITSAADTAAKADVDIPVTTVANPLDSVTRVASSPETTLEVIYRSGWIG